MNTVLGFIIIAAAFSSPVWVVYLVLMFVRWQEHRKDTFVRCPACHIYYWGNPDQHICAGVKG